MKDSGIRSGVFLMAATDYAEGKASNVIPSGTFLGVAINERVGAYDSELRAPHVEIVAVFWNGEPEALGRDKFTTFSVPVIFSNSKDVNDSNTNRTEVHKRLAKVREMANQCLDGCTWAAPGQETEENGKWEKDREDHIASIYAHYEWEEAAREISGAYLKVKNDLGEVKLKGGIYPDLSDFTAAPPVELTDEQRERVEKHLYLAEYGSEYEPLYKYPTIKSLIESANKDILEGVSENGI